MEIVVGRVKHFYPHIPAAIVELSEDLKNGDQIVIRKKNGEERLRQMVTSMEVEHKKIDQAPAGTEVAVLVEGKVKEGDIVYKLT